MSVATRGQLFENSGVKDLVGLNDEQLKTIKDNYLITALQDLALLDKANVDSILGVDKDTFVMRRKLTMVTDFIQKRGSLAGSTTIQMIMTWSRGDRSSSSSSTGKAKAKALIQFSPADFPTFSGEIADQEHYKTKAEAQIRQTVFKFLLTLDAQDQEEKERDEKLFNIFKKIPQRKSIQCHHIIVK
eukprot:14317842-Ditylum_brightwellii.AAC.1